MSLTGAGAQALALDFTDAGIGRKPTENLVVTLEVGVPIIKDYPVYNY
jgi:hypothetical protein